MKSAPKRVSESLWEQAMRRWPIPAAIAAGLSAAVVLINNWSGFPTIVGQSSAWLDAWVTQQPWMAVGLLAALLVIALAAAGALRLRLRTADDKLQVVDYGPKVASVDAVKFRSRHDDIIDARVEEVRAAIRQAKKTVLVSGIANELLTSRLGKSEELSAFFGRGGTLRAIFIDPTGEAARDREEVEGHPDNRMFKLALKSAMNIVTLRLYGEVIEAANHSKSPGDADYARVEIKLHARAPALNVLIVDDRWAAVHHYGTRSPGNISPRITVDLLEVDDDDDADEDKLIGIEASRAALSFYRADFDAQWQVADDLPQDSSWLSHANALTWKSVSTIIVNGQLRLEHPGDNGPLKELMAAIVEDRERRMSAGTELQVKQFQLEEATAQVADLTARLIDATRRAQSAGDLDGVRLRTFEDRSLRRTLVAERIKAARKSIDVVGVVNEVVTTDLPDDDFLWPFLNNGGVARALFINPSGAAVQQREDLERTHQDRAIPHGDFSRRTLNAINGLERYRDAACEVWVYERHPSVAMLIIDGSWALVTHYGHTRKGVMTPAIEVDVASAVDPTLANGLLKYFAAEYEALLGMSGTSRWLWESPTSDL